MKVTVTIPDDVWRECRAAAKDAHRRYSNAEMVLRGLTALTAALQTPEAFMQIPPKRGRRCSVCLGPPDALGCASYFHQYAPRYFNDQHVEPVPSLPAPEPSSAAAPPRQTHSRTLARSVID